MLSKIFENSSDNALGSFFSSYFGASIDELFWNCFHNSKSSSFGIFLRKSIRSLPCRLLRPFLYQYHHHFLHNSFSNFFGISLKSFSLDNSFYTFYNRKAIAETYWQLFLCFLYIPQEITLAISLKKKNQQIPLAFFFWINSIISHFWWDFLRLVRKPLYKICLVYN